MNCPSFAETISELARDRQVDQIEPTLRVNVLEHLNECSDCRLSLQEERGLTRVLRELATEMRSMAAPARVEEQLLASFRQSLQRPEQKLANGGRWALAVAAVLLVMFGVAGLAWRLRNSSPHRVESAKSVAENLPKKSPETVVPPSTGTPAQPRKQLPVIVRRATPRRLVRATSPKVNTPTSVPTNETVNNTQVEIATHFMPLGYAGPINPQDGGQLVRVELPRSAMLSMGLPVNMDRYGERVKADVLLGPDGLARAIRFVQ